MDIVKKFLETRDDGVDLYISRSDEGYKIRKKSTGEVYDEAVDCLEFEYEETDIKIDKNNDLQ